MEKLFVIIQLLLNKLSAAYKKIFDLKDLVEAQEQLLQWNETTEKDLRKRISDERKRCETYELTITGLRNDRDALRESVSGLKEKIKAQKKEIEDADAKYRDRMSKWLDRGREIAKLSNRVNQLEYQLMCVKNFTEVDPWLIATAVKYEEKNMAEEMEFANSILWKNFYNDDEAAQDVLYPDWRDRQYQVWVEQSLGYNPFDLHWWDMKPTE